MRAYLSVFMLMVRSSIYKVVGLFLLLAGAEYMLFQRAFQPEVLAFQSGVDMIALEDLLTRSRLPWALGIVFLLLTVILCHTGCSFGSRTEYILKRLSISERQVMFCQALYNGLCYGLLLMVQIVLAFWFCQMYAQVWDGAAEGHQIVFLAFYRSEFLHCILPLEDLGLWIRNLILVIGLGVTSAFYPYQQRRGKNQAEIMSMCLLVALWFFRELGSPVTDFFAIVLTLILFVVVANRMLDSEAKQEESL